MADEAVRVLVDVQEGRSGIPAMLDELGAEVELVSLPAGDYALGADTVVERKRVLDLHGSVRKGHLWAQLAKLRVACAFPLLRPASSALERWATSLEGDLSEDDLEAGRALAAGERERIVALCTGKYHAVWDVLVEEFGGDAHEAEEIVVAGAIAAFVAESREPHPNDLLHLERCEGCRARAAQALARVLEGCDLWSVLEASSLAGVYEDAGDLREFETIIRTVAAASWTPEHDQRLTLLVQRVRLALPMRGRPLASDVLAEACVRFDADEAVRAETAALMLESALDAFDAIEARRAA